MKTGNKILEKEDLQKKWTINAVKQDFQYFFHHQIRRLVVTIWLDPGMKFKQNGKFKLADGRRIDVYSLKSKILRSLKQNGNLFLDEHLVETDVMDIVPTSWISGQYPDATNFGKEEFDINAVMEGYLLANNDELLEWCSDQANLPLQAWTGNRAPKVEIRMIKPFTRINDSKRIVTRAMGIFAPRNYTQLINHILQKTDS